MFRVLKIEQHDLPKASETAIAEAEFEIVFRFTSKDLAWGWKDSLTNVIRQAIYGISPTSNVS